jgi:hypothetical protein
MKRILIGGIATTLTCLISACGSNSDPTSSNGQANIEFYNEMTNSRLFATAASVTVDVSDSSSTVLSKVKYSTGNADNAASATVSDGKVAFNITLSSGGTGGGSSSGSSSGGSSSGSGGGSSILQDSPPVTADSTTTIVLMGDRSTSPANLKIASFEQSSDTVNNSNVRFRVINTLSNVGAVDLAVGTTTIATGLAFGGATDYQTVAQSGRTLDIDITQGTDTVTKSCRVQAGNSYDVILAYVNYRGSNATTLMSADVGLFCHQTL